MLSAKAISDLWEASVAQTPAQMMLQLLQWAFPAEKDVLIDLPLGQRNFQLLQLRRQLFGEELNCITHCTACSTTIEFTLLTETLCQQITHYDLNEIFALATADYVLQFRLLTSRDLLAIANSHSIDQAIDILLQRCILNLCSIQTLSEEIIHALTEKMLTLDPLAEITIDLICPDCEQQIQQELNLDRFFWKEFSTLATQLLTEVHHLALAYGWQEQDILAMNEQRRRFYLSRLHP